MRKWWICFKLLFIFLFFAAVSRADDVPYKNAMLITNLEKHQDSLGCWYELELPFEQFYGMNVVTYGKDITYQSGLYGYVDSANDRGLTDGQEVLALVTFSSMNRNEWIVDDTQKVIDFWGNLGNDWNVIKQNPYYAKHYPYIYDDGEPVRFAVWEYGYEGNYDPDLYVAPHDPIAWTDESFPRVTVGPNPNNPKVVPEPISSLLFGVGGIAFICLKKKGHSRYYDCKRNVPKTCPFKVNSKESFV